MARRSEGAGSRPSAGSARSSGGLDPHTAGAAFALLRIFVGLSFLVSGLQKWQWLGARQLANTVTRMAESQQGTGLENYGNVLLRTVVPHSVAVTWLVVGGEIVVGLLLTLGLLSRVVALYALVLNVAYLLGYWHLGAQWQLLNGAFLMMEAAFLMVGPGRTFGIDARLARRRPRWLLW